MVAVTRGSLVRGEVVSAALDPAFGAEQGKVRPVVVLTNDGANRSASRRGYGVVTVAPLTTNTRDIWPQQVLLPAGEGGIPRESKVQVEQLRSIDVSRVIRTLGVLGAERMAEIDEALRAHLGL